MDKRRSTKRSLATVGIFYGMVGLGDTILWAVIASWQNYYYFPPDGAALVPIGWLYGLLMFAHAAIGTIIALPIGYWSDHMRTRWGRRLPLMFIAGLPRLIFFVMLWTPPLQTESNLNLYYLAAILICHSIAANLQQVPNEALLPELAATDEERIKISAWSGSLALIGMVMSGFTGVAIEYLGYVKAVSLYALLTLPLFYLPFLVLREPPSAQAAKTERPGILKSFSLVAHNRAFLNFGAIKMLGTSSLILIQTMFPFIVTELFLLSAGDTAYFYIAGLIAAFACYPLVMWLSRRFGKQRVFSGALLGAALVLPGLLLIGDWLPVPLMIPGLVWVTLEASVLSGSSTLEEAFIAEIIDHDAEMTGQRREGAYYAALEFVERIVYSTVAMVPPILLVLGRGQTGSRGPLGVRIVGLLGGGLSFVAFLLFRHYPLRDAPRKPAGS